MAYNLHIFEDLQGGICRSVLLTYDYNSLEGSKTVNTTLKDRYKEGMVVVGWKIYKKYPNDSVATEITGINIEGGMLYSLTSAEGGGSIQIISQDDGTYTITISPLLDNGELVWSGDYYFTFKVQWEPIKVVDSTINAISYDTALHLIRNELVETMEDNYGLYKDLQIYIANEQEFIKTQQQKPNAVYIVLRYNSASVNFGQTVLPVTITAVAEQNKVDKVQKLLSDFVAKFNLVRSENNTIQQIYETPVVTSNFNVMYEGFRSVMYVSGFLVVSKTANFLTFYYKKSGNINVSSKSVSQSGGVISPNDVAINVNESYLVYRNPEPDTYTVTINQEDSAKTISLSNSTETLLSDTTLEIIRQMYGIEIDYEDVEEDYTLTIKITTYYKSIDYINSVFGGNTQIDTQAFYNVSNFTKSVARTGTITFAITTYLLSSIDITNDVLDVYFKRSNINNNFKIVLQPAFGASVVETFKLVDCNIQSEIGQIPMITMTFTN